MRFSGDESVRNFDRHGEYAAPRSPRCSVSHGVKWYEHCAQLHSGKLSDSGRRM